MKNYTATPFSSSRRYLYNPLAEVNTESIELFLNRNFFMNEKLIIWLLNSCVNLTELKIVNFPNQGIFFLNQFWTLDNGHAQLKTLGIWDNLNIQFFNNMITKFHDTLTSLIYFTVEPEIYLDLLNCQKLEKL